MAAVTAISIEKFRRKIRKEQFVELYNVKDQVSKSATLTYSESGTEQRVNLDTIVKEHKQYARLVDISMENKKHFWSSFPQRLSRKPAIDYKTELNVDSKPPYRKLYQLSPAQLLAEKEYIHTNLKMENLDRVRHHTIPLYSFQGKGLYTTSSCGLESVKPLDKSK